MPANLDFQVSRAQHLVARIDVGFISCVCTRVCTGAEVVRGGVRCQPSLCDDFSEWEEMRALGGGSPGQCLPARSGHGAGRPVDPANDSVSAACSRASAWHSFESPCGQERPPGFPRSVIN